MEKELFLVQNHGLTPLEKCQFFWLFETLCGLIRDGLFTNWKCGFVLILSCITSNFLYLSLSTLYPSFFYGELIPSSLLNQISPLFSNKAPVSDNNCQNWTEPFCSVIAKAYVRGFRETLQGINYWYIGTSVTMA